MIGRKAGFALLLAGLLATPSLADNPTTKPPCMWAGGLFSPGAVLCVGNGHALICDNGEWHPNGDANTTALIASMCVPANPAQPVARHTAGAPRD
jgi:hypothetical protein